LGSIVGLWSLSFAETVKDITAAVVSLKMLVTRTCILYGPRMRLLELVSVNMERLNVA
jgi:hypothetical protein